VLSLVNDHGNDLLILVREPTEDIFSDDNGGVEGNRLTVLDNFSNNSDCTLQRLVDLQNDLSDSLNSGRD